MIRLSKAICSVMTVFYVCSLAGCSKQPLETVAGRPPGAAGKSERARAANDAATDEKEIRALFDRFWQHVAAHEGDKALACMDQKSLDWYEGVRKDALTMTKGEMQKQDLLRQLWVLKFRRDFDKATLTRATGRELYARGITLGWFDAMAQQKIKLGYVGSNGKSAHAIIEGGADIPSFFFEKEADGWRMNETRLHEYVLRGLQQGQIANKLPADRFLVRVLVEDTGYKRPIDERIFEGPLDKLPG